MTSYKLTYFDVRGLGEPIRLLLTFGGIKYDEVRIPFDESWLNIKSEFPFGQVPVLDINNKRVFQSVAISRYLGKLFKLNGRNDWENMMIDIAVQNIEEFRLKINPFVAEKDEERKEKIFKTFIEEHFPFYLSKLEAMAKENRGYLANSSLTWADVYFVGSMDSFNHFSKVEDFTADYPNLKKVVAHVKSHPNLKKYFETRKDLPF